MKSRILWTSVGVAALAMLSGQGQQPTNPGRPGEPGRPGSTPPVQPGTPGTPGRPNMPPPQPDRDTPPSRPGQPGMDSQRVGQPGEQHKAIDWMEGMWTATATQWRSEGAEPMEFQGMLNSQWVLDGRFLRNEFKSQKEGTAFQGLSYIGFNSATDEYEGTWMDTTSTQLAHSTGHYSKETNTLTMHGEFTDQQTKRKVETRTEARMESPDRWTWEMYNKPEGGDEFKSLQVVFTKGAAGMDRPRTTTPTRPGISPPSVTPPTPSTPPGGIRPSEPTRPGTPRPSDPGRPSTPPPSPG